MYSRISLALVSLLSLWVGGLITLFVAVQGIFAAAPSREMAGTIASTVFRRFEAGQMAVMLAAAVLALVYMAAMARRRTRWHWVALAGVGAACGTTAVNTLLFTPKIESMRVAGQTATVAFKTAHATSMVLYSSQTAVLLAACVLLIALHFTRPSAGSTAPAA